MGCCLILTGQTASLGKHVRATWESDNWETTHSSIQRTDLSLNHHRMPVCLDGADGLPKGVLATPCINTLHQGRKQTKLPIELINHSSKAATIPVRARVCDLYSTEDIRPIDQDVLQHT